MTAIPTPLVYTTYGTAGVNLPDYWRSADALADYCVKNGFKTVLVEIGQVDRAYVEKLQGRGLKVIIWNVVDASLPTVVNTLKPDGVCPQIEGPGQYDGAVAGLRALKAAGVTLPLEHSVVTTYWGIFDPTNDTTIRSGSKYKVLQDLGVTSCWVETYTADGHANVDAMLWQGQVYGIPASHLRALLGTYNGELPASYVGADKLGRAFGLYEAEQLSPAAWAAWGALNAVPAPPPAPLPTTRLFWQVTDNVSGKLLHEERATTWTEQVPIPGSTLTATVVVTGLQRCVEYIAAHLADVRLSGDVELKRVSR